MDGKLWYTINKIFVDDTPKVECLNICDNYDTAYQIFHRSYDEFLQKADYCVVQISSRIMEVFEVSYGILGQKYKDKKFIFVITDCSEFPEK